SVSSSSQRSSGQIAAGFPRKTVAVKASTCQRGTRMARQDETGEAPAQTNAGAAGVLRPRPPALLRLGERVQPLDVPLRPVAQPRDLVLALGAHARDALG